MWYQGTYCTVTVNRDWTNCSIKTVFSIHWSRKSTRALTVDSCVAIVEACNTRYACPKRKQTPAVMPVQTTTLLPVIFNLMSMYTRVMTPLLLTVNKLVPSEISRYIEHWMFVLSYRTSLSSFVWRHFYSAQKCFSRKISGNVVNYKRLVYLKRFTLCSRNYLIRH